MAAERSLVALEGCEDGAALGGFVMVLDQETRHVRRVAPSTFGDIGSHP